MRLLVTHRTDRVRLINRLADVINGSFGFGGVGEGVLGEVLVVSDADGDLL